MSNSDETNLDVYNEGGEDEFDKIFFEKHGLGNNPVDRELVEIAHRLDTNKPTARECDFVRRYARGERKTDAYIKAFGYSGTEMTRAGFNMAANRLLKRPRVNSKFVEYQSKVQQLADEDMATLVDELNQAKELARDMAKPADMISAIKAKASLLGIDSGENRIVNNISVTITDVQKDRLLNRMKKLSGEDGDIEDAEIIGG